MSTLTIHLPREDEVRIKTRDGRRGVRKKVAVFGPLIAVKFDGETKWRNWPRNELSSKEV